MPTSPKPRVRPWESKQERKPHQGRAERSKEYNTSRWVKARKAYLQANPLCVACGSEGRITAANVLDHIIRVRDGAAFYDASNWQSLCTSCHNRKSARERHGK